MKIMNQALKLGALTVASFLATTATTQAQEITLRSSDGTVNMTGDFVGFEDNAYVIRTALGQLRVAASRVSCDGAACPDFSTGDVDLAISGADEIGAGLMPLLLEGYAGAKDAAAEINNTGRQGQLVAKLIGEQGFGDDLASIEITSSTTSQGLVDLLDENSEIAMASRRIQPDEARRFAEAGAGNMIDPSQEHLLAIDSLIIITNPNNPITTLDVRQLAGLYSGAVTNWSQVGGPNLPVEVVIRDVGENRSSTFEASLFGDSGATLTANAERVSSSNEVAQFVNSTPGAIGVVGYAFQRGANTVNIVNQCGIVTTPDAFSAKTEEYALQRRLFLYTREGELTDNGSDFLQYATSPEADSVIRKAGFIGFNVDRREQSLADPRAQAMITSNADNVERRVMDRMMARMGDYDRLSTTFRFRTGSSQLDERGQIDKERLVEYLSTQPSGSEVLVVGFTDDVGQFEGNLALAERRAAQVADEISAFAAGRLPGISLSTDGYGEVAPSGCNVTDEGRRINRRVEIWIKSPA